MPWVNKGSREKHKLYKELADKRGIKSNSVKMYFYRKRLDINNKEYRESYLNSK